MRCNPINGRNLMFFLYSCFFILKKNLISVIYCAALMLRVKSNYSELLFGASLKASLGIGMKNIIFYKINYQLGISLSDDVIKKLLEWSGCMCLPGKLQLKMPSF